MTAEEFVRLLNSISPAVKNLVTEGYDTTLAEEEISAYFPQKTDHLSPSEDELVKLCFLYKFSGEFPLGIKFFLPVRGDHCWQIGEQDCDRLVVDDQTGAVQVEEFTTERWILFRCASNSLRFLESFGEALRIFPKTDKSNYAPYARTCAEIAGGDEYTEFFSALLYKP